MPTRKFAGMKVVQPVGVFPRAAKAAVHCASRNTPWTKYSMALITSPAANPPKIKRGMFGRAVVAVIWRVSSGLLCPFLPRRLQLDAYVAHQIGPDRIIAVIHMDLAA